MAKNKNKFIDNKVKELMQKGYNRAQSFVLANEEYDRENASENQTVKFLSSLKKQDKVKGQDGIDYFRGVPVSFRPFQDLDNQGNIYYGDDEIQKLRAGLLNRGNNFDFQGSINNPETLYRNPINNTQNNYNTLSSLQQQPDLPGRPGEPYYPFNIQPYQNNPIVDLGQGNDPYRSEYTYSNTPPQSPNLFQKDGRYFNPIGNVPTRSYENVPGGGVEFDYTPFPLIVNPEQQGGQSQEENTLTNQREPVQAVNRLTPVQGGDFPTQEQITVNDVLNPYPEVGLEPTTNQPTEFQTLNPYGGVDIPSAAMMFGRSIQDGNVPMSVMSGLKVGAGLGRNILSGMGLSNAQTIQEELRRKNQRNYNTQASGYLQDGGEYLNTGIQPQEAYNGPQMDNARALTGEYLEGISENNQNAIPNAELEAGEHIIDNQGGSIQVEGRTHSQGGEDVELQDGDRVISNHLNIGGTVAKQIRDTYGVKVKAKNTFAEVVDKVYKKIGLQELIETEEEILKNIEDQSKDTENEETKNLNLEYLYKKLQEVQEQKNELEPYRQEVLNEVYSLQEMSKGEEDLSMLDIEETEEFQDGGLFLSPFAKTYFTGTEAERGLIENQMKNYFTPGTESFEEVNKRKESMEEHLERMRPVYEELLNRGYDFSNYKQDTKDNPYIYFDNLTPQVASQFQDGGEFLSPFAKTYFTGTPEQQAFIQAQMNDYFTPGTESFENANRARETMEQHLERMRPIYERMLNSGYDFNNYENDLKSGRGIDTKLQRGGQYLNAETLEYLNSIGALNPNFDFSNEVQNWHRVPTNAYPEVNVSEQVESAPEVEKRTEILRPDTEEVQRRNVTPIIPMYPSRDPLPPTALQPQVAISRNYDRIRPQVVEADAVIQNNNEQAARAMQSLEGMSGPQRAAAMAQISSNTQRANAEAMFRVNLQNANMAMQADQANQRVQHMEENARAQDALSYEQRAQTAKAKTDESYRNFFENLQKINQQNFEDVRRMNTINANFENMQIDSEGNILTTGVDDDYLNRFVEYLKNNPNALQQVLAQVEQDDKKKK